MQKYILFCYLFLSYSLYGENSADRYLKNREDHGEGFGLHADVGYSSYLIELDSSELNSAIDYDVLELTLGGSYAYEQWMWGIYGKFLLQELESNMYVVTTQKALGDQANIDKKEFAFYSNYTFHEQEDERWRINFIYRFSSLKAKDFYTSFNHYSSMFDYETEGLALSLLYLKTLNKKNAFFLQGGLLYTFAKVKMSESVNAMAQDSFIDDRSSAWGEKLGMGYSHRLSKALFFILKMDAWRLNFSKLNVNSRVGDYLPQATLTEQSFSTYGGFSWQF